jgi:hypothetical protein
MLTVMSRYSTMVGLSEYGQSESTRALVGSSDAAWVKADPPSVQRIKARQDTRANAEVIENPPLDDAGY